MPGMKGIYSINPALLGGACGGSVALFITMIIKTIIQV